MDRHFRRNHDPMPLETRRKIPQSPTSVANPTLGKVESSLRELDEAIIGHTKWLTEWNTRIICGIQVEDKYIAQGSHRESYFGRWYYAEHARFLHQYPSFVAIDELHRQVHNGMSAIVKKADGRNRVGVWAPAV